MTERYCDLIAMTERYCDLIAMTEIYCDLIAMTERYCDLIPVTERYCDLIAVTERYCDLIAMTERYCDLIAMTERYCDFPCDSSEGAAYQKGLVPSSSKSTSLQYFYVVFCYYFLYRKSDIHFYSNLCAPFVNCLNLSQTVLDL